MNRLLGAAVAAHSAVALQLETSQQTQDAIRDGLILRLDTHQGGGDGSWISNDLLFLGALVIALLGASLTVFGMLTQKLAHQHHAAAQKAINEDAGWMDSSYCTWRWVLGIMLFITGNIVSWVSLGMGPQSVLACFNSWNIVLSMIVAPYWFGETNSRVAKLAATLLIGGCIWVSVTGPRPYKESNVHTISNYFRHLPFLICCAVLGTFLVVGKWAHSVLLRSSSFRWALPGVISVTSMAAIFGCYAMLFSKCTSMVVNTGVTHSIKTNGALNDVVGKQVTQWQFLVWGAATVVCGVCQIHFLNESLRHGNASFVIPFYESCGMALQVTTGGVFFQEYEYFSPTEHAKFWPGIFLVLLGLIGFSLARATTEDKMEEASEDEQAQARSDPSEPDRAAGGVAAS